MDNQLQQYSNLCATYGDIKIRIIQIKRILADLETQASQLEKKLLEERSELKIEGGIE